MSDTHPTAARRLDLGATLLTLLSIIAAAIWFFPVYWGIATSLRYDDQTVKDFALIPKDPTLKNYIFDIQNSNLPSSRILAGPQSKPISALALGSRRVTLEMPPRLSTAVTVSVRPKNAW